MCGPTGVGFMHSSFEMLSSMEPFLGKTRDENGTDVPRYPSVPKGSKPYMDSMYLNLNI